MGQNIFDFGLNYEKIGGQKSRWTVPLKVLTKLVVHVHFYGENFHNKL